MISVSGRHVYGNLLCHRRSMPCGLREGLVWGASITDIIDPRTESLGVSQAWAPPESPRGLLGWRSLWGKLRVHRFLSCAAAAILLINRNLG